MLSVPKLQFSEPRHNLPGRKGVATAEDRFTIAFARAYFLNAHKIHRGSLKTKVAMAREIPITGFGISDLMTVSWAPEVGLVQNFEEFIESARPSSRAFEVKLNDWRGGLTQATRYRFFSHQSILVLPTDVCEKAALYLDTFRKVKVGIWSFETKTGAINVYHTPRLNVPKSPRHHLDALRKVNKATKRVLPIA
ncbi:MAG: hypothetical protein P1V20_09205 [Verrucomicrobiales bacterium]|nr:hypothetical protein [Verrucomicrobiales bacterium]